MGRSLVRKILVLLLLLPRDTTTAVLAAGQGLAPVPLPGMLGWGPAPLLLPSKSRGSRTPPCSTFLLCWPGTRGTPSAMSQQLLKLRCVLSGHGGLLQPGCCSWIPPGMDPRCQEPWDERGLGLLEVLRGVWGRAGLQVLHHRLVFNQIKWISKHSFLFWGVGWMRAAPGRNGRCWSSAGASGTSGPELRVGAWRGAGASLELWGRRESP